MRIQLTPRRSATFGQDFVAERINRRLNVTPLIAGADGEFPIESIPEQTRLVISHNPDDGGEARLLASLPVRMRSVVHRHVQWSYLDAKQQDNMRRSMASAALCIAPAGFLAEESRELFPETPREVVHIGRDPAIYRPATVVERTAFRENLSVPDDAFIISHVGRLENAKGLQILLSLAELLPPNFVLLIQFTASASDTGGTDGFWPQARAIQAANANQVRLWPDTDPLSDRPARYADLLISTSLKEVAPMVAVEALMCGVPVAALNSTPFYAELHAHGVAPEDLIVVGAPHAARLALLPRAQLTLTECEACAAARLIAEVIESRAKSRGSDTDTRRMRRSRQMERLGFTEDAMVSRLQELYHSVV